MKKSNFKYQVTFENPSSNISPFSISVTPEQFKKITSKSNQNISIPKKISNSQTKTVTVTDFFTNCTKINDVWRYNLKLQCNKYPILTDPSNNQILDYKMLNRQILNAHTSNEIKVGISYKFQNPTIVIIIESPHKDEYDESSNLPRPITAANGITGKKIENYISTIINDLLCREVIKLCYDKEYSIIICNPVQYQASLHHLTGESSNTKLKCDVWNELFKNHSLNVDFIDRLKSYNPCLIINACTGGMRKTRPKGLKRKVHLEIKKDPHLNNKQMVYTNHPCNWNNFGL